MATRRAILAIASALTVGALITREDLRAVGVTVVAMAALAARQAPDDDEQPERGRTPGDFAAAAERALPAGLIVAGLYLIIGDAQHVAALPAIWLLTTIGTLAWAWMAGDNERVDPPPANERLAGQHPSLGG